METDRKEISDAVWDLSGEELHALSVKKYGMALGAAMVETARFQAAPQQCLHLLVDRLQTSEQCMLAVVLLMMAFEVKPRIQQG